jgi:hypothetical protein
MENSLWNACASKICQSKCNHVKKKKKKTKSKSSEPLLSIQLSNPDKVRDHTRDI